MAGDEIADPVMVTNHPITPTRRRSGSGRGSSRPDGNGAAGTSPAGSTAFCSLPTTVDGLFSRVHPRSNKAMDDAQQGESEGIVRSVCEQTAPLSTEFTRSYDLGG